MKKLILVVMGVFLISVPALAHQGHQDGKAKAKGVAGQKDKEDCPESTTRNSAAQRDTGKAPAKVVPPGGSGAGSFNNTPPAQDGNN